MSDTPRTEAALPAALSLRGSVLEDLARQLERELAAVTAERDRLWALVQDAYDDSDSEILGTDWNDAARAALSVTP